VEHFMQDYFRHATRVGELTRIFLTELEARHVKQEPAILGFLRGRTRRKKVKDGYAIKQNRITIENPEAFFADKLNMLRLFEEALRTGYLIHPDAMREVQARLDTIDDAMRRDPEAVRIFLDLLLKHGNPERALRRMNELGVLSAFLPEFAPVVAMMQFNMYHSYTVDEHTIQVISTLAQIEREELIEELPVASRILKAGVNRKVLYVACLLHDIGKGRKEDHSIVGARIARTVCPRLGLKPAECDTVEWLVRYHLLMSDMAQKRDISDPRTVRDFAKAVKTRERLDLLTVLTVCDIRGVGPNTWNNWKATLLRGLYRATATALETGLEDLNREKLEGEGKKACARRSATGPRRTSRSRSTAITGLLAGPRRRHTGHLRRDAARSSTPTTSASTPARTRTATPRASALRWPIIRASSRASRARSASWARTSSMRAPTPPRTASPPPSSGSRTPRATPTRPRACRA
jgi:[protein-PII] uridylyltransferase